MYTTPLLPLDPKTWKPELDEFRAKTDAFYAGQMEKAAYKGFSGYFGSYAQRGAAASMLRLRMPAGRVSGPRLAFVADVLRRYQLRRLHFTTCQTIQLHDLAPKRCMPLWKPHWKPALWCWAAAGITRAM